MILKIKHTAVKVRTANSGQVAARDAKFTGAVTYSVVGTLDNQRVRHALGTEDSKIAARRVEKIETACAVGPQSAIWFELEIALPRRTFDLFAKAAGYVSAQHSASTVRPTWAALSDSFEIEMKRLVANKERGATREEGIMSESTSDRYRVSLKQFAAFLKESNIAYLDTINAPLIEMFKVVRHKQTTLLKQSRGGSGIALDISVLHRIFAYAISKGMMSSNPINLARESKPGKNPKNPARCCVGQG